MNFYKLIRVCLQHSILFNGYKNYPCLRIDESSNTELKRYERLEATIPHLRNRQGKRLKGKVETTNDIRQSWCKFLRLFWASPSMQAFIDKSDFTRTKIVNHEDECGVAWIAKAISGYIFKELFCSTSKIYFALFDSDQINKDDLKFSHIDLESAIFIIDESEIASTIMLNLTGSTRKKSGLQIKKKIQSIERYNIF